VSQKSSTLTDIDNYVNS